MKRTLYIALVVAAMLALAAPSYSLPTGTFVYCGYTIVITPDDPDHPGKSGTLTIDGSSEYAEVHLVGTYVTSDPPRPTLTVTVWGSVQVGDDPPIIIPEDDPKVFVFAPQTKRMVWKTIVAWIESIIAGG